MNRQAEIEREALAMRAGKALISEKKLRRALGMTAADFDASVIASQYRMAALYSEAEANEAALALAKAGEAKAFAFVRGLADALERDVDDYERRSGAPAGHEPSDFEKEEIVAAFERRLAEEMSMAGL